MRFSQGKVIMDDVAADAEGEVALHAYQRQREAELLGVDDASLREALRLRRLAVSSLKRSS